MDWFVQTLRDYPSIAIFLTLGLGFAALQRGKDRGWLDIRSFTIEP